MKLFYHHIAILFFVIFGVSAIPLSWAQQPEKGVDTSYFISVDEANYDSLLNNFYMQQFRQAALRHMNRKASLAYAEFDNIPDSVFVKRLQQLHMVVPMTYNAEVRAFIKMYVRIMNRRLDAMLSLSEYYFPLFEETLDRFGVPVELKYLAIVESALNPQATSRAGAAGLWQFMYKTGLLYDLEVNSLVDERRDPYKSTVAAAQYLKRLYNMYGDWQMAMAAYNCGPGGVNKAIARSGGKNSFWEIYPYLPRETRGYIPKFIGAAYVMNYYHEHGLTAGHYDIPLHVDTVNLRGDIHFAVVERFAKIDSEQLRQLNPQFRTDVVPASSRAYALTLPSDKVSMFLRYEDTIYKVSKDTITRNSVVQISSEEIIYYKVRKGDTLNSIAKKYGVSAAELRRWNGKSKNSTLKVGTRLKIYRKAKIKTPEVAVTTSKSDTIGDTVAVASVSDNGEPAAAQTQLAPQLKPVVHVVNKGENLSVIAKKYGTTVQKIRQLNNLKSDAIQVGQKLKIK